MSQFSAARTYFVCALTCDEEGCYAEVSADDSATTFSELAKENGWGYEWPEKWFCPEHKARRDGDARVVEIERAKHLAEKGKP